MAKNVIKKSRVQILPDHPPHPLLQVFKVEDYVRVA